MLGDLEVVDLEGRSNAIWPEDEALPGCPCTKLGADCVEACSATGARGRGGGERIHSGAEESPNTIPLPCEPLRSTHVSMTRVLKVVASYTL